MIAESQKQGIKKYIDLMKVHHPERRRARDYLAEWVGRTSYEGLTPCRRLQFLEARYVHGDEAPRRMRRPTLSSAYPLKTVRVARRVQKRKHRDLPQLPNFYAYLSHREGLGISREQALDEWNGMALLHTAGAVE